MLFLDVPGSSVAANERGARDKVEITRCELERTYEGSRDVAGCDPLKL